jgi:hypothetical protein
VRGLKNAAGEMGLETAVKAAKRLPGGQEIKLSPGPTKVKGGRSIIEKGRISVLR